MARIKTYQNDSTLSGLDRLTGIDSATGSVRNFTLDSLAQFLAQSGNADGSRLGFNFEYGGVYNADADDFTDGNVYIEFLDGTPESDRGFANIHALYFKNTSNDGADIVPVRSRLEGGLLKITNTSTAGERAYGLYTVTSAGTYMGSNDETELRLTYIDHSGSAGFDNFTISPFGTGSSGGGGGGAYNGFIAAPRTPIQTEGVQGDIFFDTDAKTYYRKLSATDWGSPTSLDGPQGPKGDVGEFNSAVVDGVSTGDDADDATVTIRQDTDAGQVGFTFVLPPGSVGPEGPTPGVGTVNTTTGSAGTDAAVTINKSGDNLNFNFTVPRGEKGSAGSGSTIQVDGPSDYENTSVTTIDFEGSGVSVAGSGSTATVTITDSDQFASQQELENFITNKSDFRTDIGAGTSNLVLGTSATTALAGNTTTISDAQAQSISQNTAKLTANTANVQSALGISGSGNNALFLTQQGNFVAASGGGGSDYVLPIAGTTLGGVQVFNNSDIAISNTGAISIKSASVTNAKLTSGSATDGQVLTADGSGGAAWEDASGGGTTVVANPGGTDGDSLTRITIGSTNYNISGSGGSSVSINGTSVSDPDFITEKTPGGITIASEAAGIELTVNSSLNASSNATDGYVLTADGSGGVAWEMAPGAGSGTAVSIEGSAVSAIDIEDNSAAGGINVTESSGDVTFAIHSSPGGTNATDGYVLTADGSGGVAWEATSGSYTLPAATASALGGVIVEAASEIDVDSDGKLTLGTIAIDATEVTTGQFAVARIPDLAASKVTSGTFVVDRIPDLSTAKITSGVFNRLRISTDTPTDGQVLTWDNTNSVMIWADTAGTYTLPAATASALGGVIVESSSDIDVDSDGKLTLGDLSANKITSDTFAVARIPDLTASKITDFDTEVSNNTSVTANTAKVTFPGFGTSNTTALRGDTTTISAAQATAISTNSNKNSYDLQLQEGGSDVGNAGIGKINFTGDVDVTANGDTITVHIAGSNAETPPTISLAQTGFDEDSQPSVSQSITFTATVVANDATITNVVFSATDSKFSDVTDTTSPYTTAQSFNFANTTPADTVTVTATLNYILDGTAATLTDTVTMSIAKANPVWAPDYTYSDFNVTPNDTNIEAFDTGDIGVSDNLDTSNNNGWNIDGTETYSPTLDSSREFSVTSTATDVGFTVTTDWDSTGSGGEELDDYEIVDHTWKRIRSIRLGGKTASAFSASSIQDLTTFTEDVVFGTTDPTGKQTLHRSGGEYLYFAYDATMPDVDLDASTQGGFPINDTWMKESGTPGGFKVYRGTSTGGAISKTDGFSINIVLQSS